MDGPVKTVEQKKFSFFDIDGKYTDIKLTDKKKVMHLVIAAVLFFGFYFAPLQFISKNTPAACAVAVTAIYLWIVLVTDLFTTCLIMSALALYLKLLTFAQLRTTFAGSQFLPFIGICAVAVGATNTLLTTRFSYWVLWKVGKSPRLIVACAVLVTMLISSSVSNVATGVLVGSIFYPVVENIGDREKLGRALMIAIPMGSMYGGISFPSGSSPNLVCIQNIAAVTKDKYTVAFGTWAGCGWPVAIVLGIMIVMIYPAWFKVPKRNENIDVAFFKQKLDDIGPVTGAEIRWLILITSMIFFLISGADIGNTGIIYACLCCAPGIGILSGPKLLKILPWTLLFLIGLSPMMANFLGPVADYLVKPLVPMLGGMGMFGLMLFIASFRSWCNSILLGTGHSVLLLMISIFAPICVTLGYNPAFVMMPMFIISSPGVVFGASGNFQTCYQYGYWKITDTIRPGLVFMVLAPVVSTVVCYFMLPILGISSVA